LCCQIRITPQLARNSRKSPAHLRNTPVLGRLCAETFSIGTAWEGGR
jgi:hypothetical protein